MSETSATFSEAWYRVANQRLYLRPGLRIRRQSFRGQSWFVLENPLSNQFFRLRPVAYEFVARLRPDRTVEEVWKECLNHFPDEAPGQEAVIQLLSQLYHASLLQYSMAEDARQLFQRYEKTRQRETRSRLLNIMFMRFPLLDPDRFLVRTLPAIGKLISPLGALIWMAVIAAAIKVGIDHFSELWAQGQGLLAPGNLVLLYAAIIVTKTCHEFGHAYFCRRFGGEVHVLGIMLLIFTPIPYMDATSSWGFRSRWQRMLVGGAGMIVELFIAALAMFVWANTGQGVVHSLAYNMMFVASVSTLIFNLNPLLRFDGYYMLSDLLEIPNLHQRALRQLKHGVERYVFGVKQSQSPAQSRSEAGWLACFGITSGLYRIFVFASILLFVADQYLLLGLLMAVVCSVSWIVTPLYKLVSYLASSPRLARTRWRAIGAAMALLSGVFVLFQFIPLPHHFRAPGVLNAREWTHVVNESAGVVSEISAKPGSRVAPGQALILLKNPQLTIEWEGARARIEEIQARILQARQAAAPNLKPLNRLLESAQLNVKRLEADLAALTIRARQDGVWIAPRLEESIGRWIDQGTDLGLVVDSSEFQFLAPVGQEDGDRLFDQRILGAEIRLAGRPDLAVPVREFHVIPAEKRQLPSAALGWASGGPVAVASDDPQGQQTIEPFFEVRAEVASIPEATLWHGWSGQIRFSLPSEPLLPRWIRKLQQLLQKRYQW